LIAGFYEADLVLRRKRGDIRQQPVISRIAAAGKQMYGNGPSCGNLAGSQCMVGLDHGIGDPPGHLESFIEAHVFPIHAMGLAAHGRPPHRL
jgi:hypothetical protein